MSMQVPWNASPGVGRDGWCREAFPFAVAGSVWERAGELHRRVVTSDVWEGGCEGVGAGCLFVACREASVPVTVTEIAEFAGVDNGMVVTISMVIQRNFDVTAPPVAVERFVDRFVEELQVGECVSGIARELAVVCDEYGVAAGRAPRIVAAACVYVAESVCASRGDENVVSSPVTQSDVAGVAGTTVRSVRGAVMVIRDRVTVWENPRFNRGASDSVGVQVSVDEQE